MGESQIFHNILQMPKSDFILASIIKRARNKIVTGALKIEEGIRLASVYVNEYPV